MHILNVNVYQQPCVCFDATEVTAASVGRELPAVEEQPTHLLRLRATPSQICTLLNADSYNWFHKRGFLPI